MQAEERGTVKVYFPFKEYGFITRVKGRDIFFVRSAFADESQIVEGAEVEFTVEQTDRGSRAAKIKRIG